jgi:hypothetical protein
VVKVFVCGLEFTAVAIIAALMERAVAIISWQSVVSLGSPSDSVYVLASKLLFSDKINQSLFVLVPFAVIVPSLLTVNVTPPIVCDIAALGNKFFTPVFIA